MAFGTDRWATSLGDLAFCELTCRLGVDPGYTSAFWTSPECWDADDIALEIFDTPDIWTDGKRGNFVSTGGFEVAGAGVLHLLLGLLLGL